MKMSTFFKKSYWPTFLIVNETIILFHLKDGLDRQYLTTDSIYLVIGYFIFANVFIAIFSNSKTWNKSWDKKKNVNVYYFTGEGRRIFIQAMRERMLEIHQYVEVDKKRYTFFYMADLQIKGLIRAFESLKPELYVTGYTGE